MARLHKPAPVALGDHAPDFTLPDQGGQPVRLYDLLRTGPVVLFFYPKDNTAGCTAEACAFRDSFASFVEAGVQVAGISSDSVASHAAFAARHHLPFLLLSDQGGAVRRLYGVPSTLGLLPGRVTYIIDGAGVVRHTFTSQFAATQHVREAMATLAQLGRGQSGQAQ
jgi:peroxiredoxin Q/BCP